MPDVTNANLAADDLRRRSLEYWRRNQPQAALDTAWVAFDLVPNDRAIKSILVKLLHYHPATLQIDRRAAYLRLLIDREVEPDLISRAGWQCLLGSRELTEKSDDSALEALVTDLECDELALTLLREAPVCLPAAERILCRLRRWLLHSGRWQRHPEMVTALIAQAGLNGGAWPFDESERALLVESEVSPMAAAYLPVREPKISPTGLDTADRVTRAVAAQYEGWPFPVWTRITVGKPRRLPDVVRKMDFELAKALPVDANMLIAGCGTGRQAASVALSYPDASVTAIDVSEASLDYGRRQCAALGIDNVRFVKLDLHAVAHLNQRYHAIHCAGVLHHLPDPEHGLKVLADVLQPGGVMHIMVYNRHERMMITGARTFLISDLAKEPVSDDLLRRVRQRFLQQPEHPAARYILGSRLFSTLAGTYDLLLHRHEDPFDMDRIEHALDHAEMRMLSFDFPFPFVAARYDAMFPEDPKRRDIRSLASFERSDPSMLLSNYSFWAARR